MDPAAVFQALLSQGNLLNAFLLYLYWSTNKRLWEIIKECRREREEATSRLVSVTEALKALNRENQAR